MHRRDFLKIVGFTSLAASTTGLTPFLTGCQTRRISNLNPNFIDDVTLAPNLSYKKLLSWGDPINSSELYGDTNDFISILKMPNTSHDYFFWINHEYPIPYLTHGVRKSDEKEKTHIHIERKNVGGSLLHFKKASSGWEFQKNSIHNMRWDANTRIPFAWQEPIQNSQVAIGTLANCSGGQTPWGTFLTCEENYDEFYGEVHFENEKRIHKKKSEYGWSRFYNNPPEHYGWVVEVDPITKKSHKLIAMGRFAHEGAKVVLAKDKRAVVYMGDDKNDEFIYKFIADTPGSLKSGKLYVANTNSGSWELLSLENPKLSKKFKSQTELLIRTREAARIAGGTEQDRPEDIEVLADGTILVALTNNIPKKRPHGQIFAIFETNNDPLSLTFKSSTWLACGPQSGISCPDNFTVDAKGHLWVTSDMSGSLMGPNGIYAERGHNGLFMIPTSGSDKGVVYQIASAPVDAEFTGPCWSDDGQTLFLCVQHPGERSHTVPYTSHWPHKKPGSKPLSSLIAIEGFDKII
jgi:secreted PhoX family phosphatase